MFTKYFLIDLLGPTDLLREKSLESLPSVAVCSGPEFVEAGDGFEAGVWGAGLGISFSADFLRLVHGLESLNFSLRDFVLMNRDLFSPFSSWLLQRNEQKANFKFFIFFLSFFFFKKVETTFFKSRQVLFVFLRIKTITILKMGS